MTNRINIQKTYKLYIKGQFPRTESGRYYLWTSPDGKTKVNICLSSRKDFREAVVAAREAFSGWSKSSAYNRGQILYRMAEIMEGRKEQFINELKIQGLSSAQSIKEVNETIDRLVYYAGWSDKFQQIFSSVNPVASSHFNFSVPEPTGVVDVIAPEESPLLGLVSIIAPIITGGNTCVVLASNQYPLCSISLAEVLNSSDLPPGVVNILTGTRNELLEHFATHMDVNSIYYSGTDDKEIKYIQEKATLNVKRVIVRNNSNWVSEDTQSPYHILDFQEIKTTWHPVGI